MGTVSSALLAHLSGICISGQVTEALLRGQRPAREACHRGEQEAARDDALPVVLLPTETSLEPGLHCGCCTEGKGSVCVCVRLLQERVSLEGRTGCLWAYGIAVLCLPQPPAWETRLLLQVFLLCLLIHFHPPPLLPMPREAWLWPRLFCHLWWNKISFTCSPGRHWAAVGCYIKQWLCHWHRHSCFSVQVLARCMSAALLLPGGAVWWLHPQKKALGLACTLSVFNSQPRYQKAMYKILSLLLPKGVYSLLCFSHEHWFYSMLLN